jgi:SAM-dependent methyltransferase
LSEAIIKHYQPASLTAIDQSEGFVNTTQNRLGKTALCKVGDALALPLDDNSVDFAVSGLVLNFIPEPEKALAEMRRVTVDGGTVAVYVWDYAGTMEFLNIFWDVATALNPKAADLHEGKRFPESNAQGLGKHFEQAGFVEISSAPIQIDTRFKDFDDYWRPFLGGQGPAPTYLLSLADRDQKALKAALREHLPIQKEGSIHMVAQAWAMRGQA